MEKEIAIFACLYFTIFLVSAQSVGVQVIGASGDHYVEGNQVSMSIGEAIIEHYSTNDNQITSGFLQPLLEVEEIEVVNGINPVSSVEIDVFPNPTVHYLNMRMSSNDQFPSGMTGHVYSESGRVVKYFTFNPNDNYQQLDFSNLPVGIYIMTLQSQDATNTYKIKKN